MADFQHFEIMGHLTRDPKLSYTPNQIAVCNGGIAETERWTSKSGEKQERVLFIDYVLFNKPAETFHTYLSKGDPVLLIGKLQLDRWTDKATGANRSTIKLAVREFIFLPRPGAKSSRAARGAPLPESPELPYSPNSDDSVPPF